MPARAARPFPIAILTDFGYRDHYAGAMKGVIASIAAAAPVVDITHGVPPQSLVAGAIALRESWRYFPRGTIFLAVVDPGVGTARLPIAIESRAGARFVGPDNGLLWLAVEQAGFKRAVELTSPRYRLESVSSTFHGRDIFAPAAAYLWLGARLAAMGPEIDRIEKLELAQASEHAQELRGTVVYVDGFGNLLTNIDRATFDRFAARFPGLRLSVRIKDRAPIKLCEAYGDQPKGAPLATFGSFNMLEIAVRDGSAADRFGVGPGTPVRVRASR
jgi:S-adenosyl-L-methionine hydrolase (adenosine-forming)